MNIGPSRGEDKINTILSLQEGHHSRRAAKSSTVQYDKIKGSSVHPQHGVAPTNVTYMLLDLVRNRNFIACKKG